MVNNPISSAFFAADGVENGPGIRSRSAVGAADYYDRKLNDQSDSELKRFNWLKTRVYAQYTVEQRLDDYYYKQQFGINLIPREWQDKGFKPTIPPTAYNSVEAAADHILTTPDIYVPERPTDTNILAEREIAEKKKQALDYFWHNVFLMGDPLAKGKKKLIKDGRMVLKKEIDWDELNPKGIRVGLSNFLWKVRVLANDTVFEDPDTPEDPRYVYESVMLPAGVLRNNMPDLPVKALVGRGDDELVRVIDYWSKPEDTDQGKHIVWVANERVINTVNPYHWVDGQSDTGKPNYCGYVPYFIADSGWGDIDATRAPHERYVGIIRYIRSVIETEARQVTAADAQMRVSTFPFAIFRGIDETQDVSIKPGGKVYLDPDPAAQNIEFRQFPPVPDGIWQLISSVHSAANEAARFSQFSGMPQRGVDTATEADQNFRSANAKLAGPVDGLRSVIMRINATVLQDVEYIFEAPVALFGAAQEGSGSVVLNPEDIAGFHQTFVELKTSDQAMLDNARMRQWADMYQVFSLDREYSMKQAGIKRPQERILNRLVEDILFDPRSHELRMMLALAGEGKAGQMMAQALLQQASATNEAAPAAGAGAEGAIMGTGGGTAPALPAMPTPSGGGGFPGIAAPPSENPQNAAGQFLRATAFSRALANRPDLAAQ